MSTRHESRTILLQTLFEIDMNEALDAESSTLETILARNKKEFFPHLEDDGFSSSLFKEVISRRITVDDIIARAAPDWPIEKIDVLDRNVLRMGLTELLFADRKDTPPKVAIDEAIELAKEFGGEASGKFVNGVLGAVYKELGEPQKSDDKGKEKKKTPREELAGAVVTTSHEGVIYIAMVHDVFGYWTLSKSKLEDGERKEEAVKRACKSEMGIDVVIGDLLGENQYIANKPDQGKVIKHVVYYHARAQYQPLVVEKKGGLDNAAWISYTDIATKKMYPEIRALIEKAKENYI